MVKASLVIILCFFCKGAYSQVNRLKLIVGEISSISCESCRAIQMSRKGVVQLIKEEGTSKWSVVAMKKGHVLISFPELPRHYLVEVTRKDRSVLKSEKVFKEVKKPFWVEFHLVAVRAMDSYIVDPKQLALKRSFSFEEWAALISKSGLKMETIAHPKILVYGHDRYRMKGGAEFLVEQTGFQAQSDWKAYGFDLSLTTGSSGKCSLDLHFEAALSQPVKGKARSRLNSNILSGFTRAYCGRKKHIADLVYRSSSREENSLSFFSKVPIISPLFNQKHEQNADIKLNLFVELRKAPRT